MIAEISFPVPLRRTFYYRIEEGMRASACPGLRVLAQFGPRKAVGLIMKLHEDSSVDLSGFKEIKNIEALLDHAPVFRDDIPAIALWMQDRWNAPSGLAVENFFGQFMPDPFAPSHNPQTEKGTAPASGGAGAFLENVQPALLSAPLIDISSRLAEFVGETASLSGVSSEKARADAHVLFGPPQSGRYDVYLELARKAVGGGGQVLCLVPDLNLIAPFEERLRGIFRPECMALWHSRLTPAQRRAAWHGIRTGVVKVVLGARSAAFLPFKHLALAIIDEEQDDIYKAEEQEPNFHARDLLLRRARYHGTCVVLASAAPSMEAYFGAETGRFTWSALPCPPGARPKVSVVDMGPRRWELISGPLGDKIASTVKDKRQALVLAGRKGYASLTVCANCGWIKRCGRCRVPMGTRKEAEAALFVCWRCGRKEPMPDICPSCTGKVFRESGAGTQRGEAYIKKILPGARVERCDGDVVRKSVKDARLVYESFRKGEIDVLVGTRLLARGHDFPNLGVIGVVDSDSGLSAADFRASEKIFQTLLEAGSALSGTLAPEPEFIVQTRQPDHYVFSMLPELDYMKFARDELSARRNFFYPPFSELVRICFTSLDAKAMAAFSEEALKVLDCPAGDEADSPKAEIMGPIIFNEPKKTKVIRESYLVKLAGEKDLAWCLGRLRTLKPPKSIRLRVTADPYSFK